MDDRVHGSYMVRVVDRGYLAGYMFRFVPTREPVSDPTAASSSIRGTYKTLVILVGK